MKRTWRLAQVVVIGTTLVALGVSVAAAQTVLKFSHTDQQQGARQAAADLFREEGRAVHERPLQGPGILLQPARERPEEHRAARARRHRLHRVQHRLLCAASGHAESHHAAVPRRKLRAGLEALRRVQVAEGPVRQGPPERLPLPVHVRGRFPLHDHPRPLDAPRPTPRARSCARSPTR